MKSDYAKLVSRTTLAFSLLLAAALLAGCGGSQEEQGSEGEQGSQEETTTAPEKAGEPTAKESTTAPEKTGGATTASAGGGGDATGQVVAATEGFLATLNDAQREEATFDFDDELKTNWSNFPVPIEPRNGVALGDMTEEQQQAALAILEVALSEEGYQKTIGNMVSDQAQRNIEG